jgi:DNA polymerase (family 10)
MVDRKHILSTLEEIALLLELSGANPFKVRAYRNGARVLSSYEGDLNEGLKSGELAKLKGVGKGLLSEIEALLDTGDSPTLKELEQQVPAGLLEMIRVPGLGAKKVQVLYEKLGIANLGELEYACNENRLLELPGFGAKTQERILEGIDRLHRFRGKYLLSDAWELAERMRERVAGLNGVERCEIAGSIRRRKEIVKDIDLLVIAAEDDAPGIMDGFCALEEVERVVGSGPSKSSVLLKQGLQVDLRVVRERQFPFALAYFTGSKEHNVAMRGRAKQKGLKLNEYGLFRMEEELDSKAAKTAVRCASEAEIFAALDLAEIPPELREDRGEVQAAEAGRLPRLVKAEHLRGALHNHSRYSDGAATIEEMALGARALGWEYIGISDHSQSAFYAHGLSPDEVLRQHEEIDELNERLDRIYIFKGIESDILVDGSLDYDEDLLARFDFVVASVHSRFGLDQLEQTRRCVHAVRNPFTTVLGHPTGRLLLARDPFEVDIEIVLEAAAESQCAVELNANPRRLDLDWRLLRRAEAKGIQISIGPDAHRVEGLSDLRYGVAMARKGWLSQRAVLNTRGLAEMRSYLNARRGEL